MMAVNNLQMYLIIVKVAKTKLLKGHDKPSSVLSFGCLKSIVWSTSIRVSTELDSPPNYCALSTPSKLDDLFHSFGKQ